jgi:hypothetical protein
MRVRACTFQILDTVHSHVSRRRPRPYPSAASWGAIDRYDIRADGSYWQSGMSEPCWRFASRGHGQAVADSPDLPYHEVRTRKLLYRTSQIHNLTSILSSVALREGGGESSTGIELIECTRASERTHTRGRGAVSPSLALSVIDPSTTFTLAAG